MDYQSGSRPTTQKGYINRNQQCCEGHRGTQGNDHGQRSYKMRCLVKNCGHKYGANGSDVFQRKCPRCQGGREGIPY